MFCLLKMPSCFPTMWQTPSISQLTAVKMEHLLTILRGRYRRLRCTIHWCSRVDFLSCLLVNWQFFFVANVKVVLHSIVYFATRHLIYSWVWYFSRDLWTLFRYFNQTGRCNIVCRGFFFVIYLFRRFRFYHLLFLPKCLCVVFTFF